MIDIQSFYYLLSPARRPGVVVASYGRSGSTLLHRAIGSAMCRRAPLRRREEVFDLSWTLADRPPRRGTVCKTHDFPGALAGRSDLRSIFVFGSPIDAVRSVVTQMDREGPEWIEEHLDHLKAKGGFAELLEKDVLGLEDQLDAWSNFTASPVLCVRYEALWRELPRMQEFVALRFTLPERRERQTSRLSDTQERALEVVYGALEARIAALPDVFRGGDL